MVIGGLSLQFPPCSNYPDPASGVALARVWGVEGLGLALTVSGSGAVEFLEDMKFLELGA